MTVLPLILRLLAPQARGFLLALVLAMLTLIAGVALLAVSGWFLAGAALAGAGGAATFNLFAPSAAIRFLSMLRILSRYAERLVGHGATIRLLADLRVWLFRGLVPLVPLSRRRFRGGDLVARLTADVDALDTVFLTAISPILALVAVAALAVAALGFVLPEAAWPLAAAIGFTALLLPAATARLARRPGEAATAASAALRTALVDAVEGHADLRAHGAEGQAADRVRIEARRLGRARLGQAAVAAAGTVLVQLAAGLTLVIIAWLGAAAVAEGRLGGPMLVGLVLAILGLFEMAGPVLRGMARLGQARAAARRLGELVEAEPAVKDPPTPVLPPEGHDIVFDRVTFGHEPGRPVLRALSLAIAPGERLALVGASGSGKSTLLHLLLRLRDVEAGAIRIGGTDIRTLAQADLHRLVALMPQDAPVFLGTVRDNLLIGDPAADDDTLRRALDAAGLGGFIETLPQGLDTWLGEAGQTLSTGQARRLCLARALLSPAPILALDEPTAGLDRPTEAAFLGDLARATAGRTVLLATHADLPAGSVDRVVRLEGGVAGTATEDAAA